MSFEKKTNLNDIDRAIVEEASLLGMPPAKLERLYIQGFSFNEIMNGLAVQMSSLDEYMDAFEYEADSNNE